MRIFATVARLESFAGAARQLRLSPSVVTRAVAQLEDQLGLTLVTRTTRSLHLTERGQVYLDACRQILEDVDVAEKRARGQDAEPRGVLKLTAPVVFGRLHVLLVVNQMLAAHPHLNVRLSLSDQNLHLVDDGVDAAIRIGPLADSSLIAMRLGEVSRVLAASPAYLARRGAPSSPADLKGHDLIAFEAVDAMDEWRFGLGAKPVRLEPRLSVNSADAAIAAAEAGVGITRALSYQVMASVTAGRLVLVLPDFAPEPMPVSLVYPPRRIASANLAAFVRMAREAFRAHPIQPAEQWSTAPQRTSDAAK